MTTQSPEEIRLEIERTRAELATDVDTLHEKVSPSAIAARRTQAARSRLTAAKDRVMGSTQDVTSSASSTGHDVSEGAKRAPQAVRRQTQGNPLAAGLIAFGAGWLVSSLLPASEKEKQATLEAKDAVSEHSDTLAAPLKESAQAAKENLTPHAQQAAQSVRSTATEAAESVRGETQAARQDLGSH